MPFEAVTGPSARNYHAISYDPGREVAVLFGGTTGGGETWEWDGAGWALASSSGPSGRERAALAYDAAAGVTVLFGGLAGSTDSRESWEWDGAAWRLRTRGGPAARQRHAMAYDAQAGRVVMFGGITGTTRFSDTWTWRLPSPVVTAEPTSLVASVGESAVFQIAANGAGPLSYQWRGNGVPLVDTGRISGATTPVLTINPVLLGDAGVYDVVVNDVCVDGVSATAVLSVRGDADGDGDADLLDYQVLAGCLQGPGVPVATPCAAAFDLDADADVDLQDAARFSMLVAGL